MPRKALKNLINNELKNQSRDVFLTLLKSKDLGGAMPDPDDELYEKESSPQDEVLHHNIICDGCGVTPIKGIRYKCAIRKDFDLCELCEERLGHNYPMLKIRKAGGAPEVLITMLPEDAPPTKEENESQEQNLKTEGEDFSKRGFGRGGRGGFGRGGRGGCGFRPGMGGGFMKMVNGFMEKMGGKEKCMQMKQDWMKTMKEGTEEQKAEQWKMFGEKMSKFGQHAQDWKPEYGQDWCKGKNWGADSEGNSWNSQRAKVVTKPEGVLSASPGTSLIEEIEVLNDTFWPWKQGCSLTLADEQSFTENPIEIINVPVEQEVKGKCTMKICVPLTILPHI